MSNLSNTGEAHFQAPLVSGTNIKTINNNDILGSGDLSISASVEYCTTTPTTISTASSAHPAVVVENYKNGNNGYVKFSDGFIIQWGNKTPTSGSNTVNFLTSFTGLPAISFTRVSSFNQSVTSIGYWSHLIQTRGVSSFTFYGDGTYQTLISWMAYGY